MSPPFQTQLVIVEGSNVLSPVIRAQSVALKPSTAAPPSVVKIVPLKVSS